jgi:hypothetical protein
MTQAEVHQFGIESIVPYVQKEGITIESVNVEFGRDPQIVGTFQGSRVFVIVRTAMYPNKGELAASMVKLFGEWAEQHRALPLFASVGLACMNYPDRTAVKDQTVMQQPIKNGGFAVSFQGLVSLGEPKS